jgi:hypothetical protein
LKEKQKIYYKKLLDNIEEESYSLAELVLAYTKNPTSELEKSVVDKVYECLEFAVSLGIQALRDCFSVESKSEVVIEALTYSKDGLTVKDRILSYLHSENKYTIYHILLIMRNECWTVYNELLYNELKVYNIYCEITHANACCDVCADEYDGGIIHISQLTERPPFHPGCECEILYFTKDKNLTK